jgi:hypothetical protein
LICRATLAFTVTKLSIETHRITRRQQTATIPRNTHKLTVKLSALTSDRPTVKSTSRESWHF